ncbi:LysR family transcriptional regulator [Pseudohalioglobus sediminis]|uniref:LysR family transcriptional regulator n=1 Tax=Pseudohalioglobus sediminis TaxID=2606449 RepID=UPI00165F751D|nr:LysR family transcriptional regulator [Pseudohalioglobus sediminis]
MSALISLATIGNFKSTAATLGVPPVKLTRLVQRAEEDCGFQIFHRSRVATTLTSRGKKLLAACKELDLAAADFEHKLEQIRGKINEELKISCGPLATHTVLLPVLRALLKDRPDITATVAVTAHREPIQQLRAGEIDLFIGDLTHTTAFDDIEVMVLEKREIIFVARPGNPVLSGGPYSLAELLHKSLALPHIHRYWQTAFNDALKEAGVPELPKVPQIECDDYQTLISLAATTDIITAGTQEQLEEALASEVLARISMTARIQYNICCACRDPQAAEALKLAWQAIAENYQA